MRKELTAAFRQVDGYPGVRALVGHQKDRGLMALINVDTAKEMAEMLVTSVITDLDVLYATLEPVALSEIREYEGIKSLKDIKEHYVEE